ncbi:MAG: hypothetical protein A2315_15800 [Ignavibacteria bacterium RIFOXYB2_FULL_35_12]|nr:MAG: hypothetical protein A2058_02735 [Ignavibacteria bacterium GWA2_36_19]OGU58740.1 MAG: hypothetical protein A2X60_17225 [Ignavibacteria bacterium GWF2_35_20]OGU78515.1 MAG: hypothetical protein A2254_04515 [Ignavibacteria bacterium RIFOXYA2_FULL_35_9]OGU84513.1 MAG: hypothetical protein A3K31_08800 [Ignavibacteria bacterium RIFOXYA12_FULL_35_25]OGU92038.1 MAG: hypothetical protein A2492_01260 [Ignavibacteria bacterium RIFOXYC12_FULL_35_11]OGU95658.1 MAG: hypothetical protein A2347_00475
MAIRSIFLTLFVSVSLLHLSCSDSPSSLGADLLSQDLINILELDSAKDSLFQSSSTYKKVIALSNADRLLLGKKDNVEAGILLKFLIFFADSIKQQIINNELTVLSAKVEFTKNYTFGNSSAPIDYSVHQINSSWSTGFTSDSLTLLSFDANDISFGKTFTDTINTFNFDNQTALNWLKARADSITPIDNGLYVKPSMSSEKIIGFQALSIDDLSIPSLEIVIQKAGVYIDTLSYFPSIDLSVISGSLPDVGFENIGIQAGLNSEARLFFDLSSLPKGIVVNYAKLILTIDTIKTITGSSFTNSLRVNYLTDSTSLIIDSTFSLFLDRDSNTFEGSVTSFVQRTLIENNNQGLLLSASDKLNGVELFAIKGSNAAIFTERPKLQIIYTSKK